MTSILLRAVLVQIVACLLATLASWLLTALWPYWLVTQAAFAVGLSWALRLPRWWLVIHAGFLPLAVLALQWQLDPVWYLLAFLLAWLLFGAVYKNRVPLYLSNQRALQRLDGLIAPGARVVDLGAGVGTALSYLGRRQDIAVTGVEHAWVPWLLARLRLLLQGRKVGLLRSDLMQVDLGQFDVVYAFLSPAIMPGLWQKVRKEMQPGSLLVSNSFEVPGVTPTQVITIDDWRHSSLFVWRIE